jgi:probable H4MPT-linked C1 transfer pathway protein
MPASVIGLDIGGANLKAAHADGAAISQSFPLWKHSAELPEALHALLRRVPSFDALAVTMTGELCDCYETKRQGVNAILDAVTRVAGPAVVRVWQTDGSFVDVATAQTDPHRAAASNWLALATLAGRYARSGPALLLDIGSTTADLIPLREGNPCPRGTTDAARLRYRELVYTGARRTPLCALLGPQFAAEWFATMLDVGLVLGDIPEDSGDIETADGRPATVAAAHARLARMSCQDAETCSVDCTTDLARQARALQVDVLRGALNHVVAELPGPLQTVILAGSGEFLARQVCTKLRDGNTMRLISLGDELGPAISTAACAYAVAVLLAESREDLRDVR